MIPGPATPQGPTDSGPADEAPPTPRARWAVLAALALLLIAFALAAHSESMMLLPVDDSDEGGYMDEACWIAERGHLFGFLRACWTGAYPFYQRHPLVQILASPVARRSLDALRPVRAVKIAASVAALGLIFAAACRMVRPAAALLMVSLLALSINGFGKSRVLTAEPVVYAPFFVAWAPIAGKLRPRGRWFWAGVMLGLAYLAKGTALLLMVTLPVAWGFRVLVQWRLRQSLKPESGWRTLALRAAAPFLAGVVLVGGHLMARNAIRFGNPLRNLASSMMWVDSWAEHVMVYQEPSHPKPTLWRYLRTHSPRQIAARVAFGARQHAPRMLGGFASDRGFGRAVWFVTLAVSAALILLGLAAVVRDFASWEGAYTLCLVGVGFCLFSWYAYISYASRFTATFAPILGTCALLAGPRLLRVDKAWPRIEKRVALAVACAAIALLGFRTRWSDLRLPTGPVPTSREYRFLLDWYQREAVTGRAVCFQTPYLAPRYAMEWLVEPKETVYQIPPFETFAELQRYMDQKGARYLIVERDSLRERLNILSPYFDITPEDALRIRALPPGWALSAKDPYPPLDFVILERARTATAAPR